ncbi:tetrahydrofolate dehydrogenase/cyclohydrolase catalytic domain-containing protein [Nocardia sp. NPDC051911]|uniref:tetrahydrofolate dehydrogenase/cyclohydrolase catalytic domain-containing protein n=1 Tax=Nocardia sp. NPDC051911 TaxID=3154648 RepID=UPI00341B4529
MLKTELTADVTRLREDEVGIRLASVMAGTDFSSVAYEQRIQRLSEKMGVPYFPCRLPESADETQMLDVIHKLNDDARISGILVFRPLPARIDESTIFCAIVPCRIIRRTPEVSS